MPASGPPKPTSTELRGAFDVPSPLTVGLEEEVMLLHPETLDLLPRAAELLGRLDGDPRVKLELPAAQLELVVGPCPDVPTAAAELAAARRALAAALEGEARLAACGVHPFAAVEGSLNAGPYYERTTAEYASVANRQLVFALQVHVAVRGADRAVAVHDALRAHLPEIAALAAHAPFHGGRDTGLASIRPIVAGMLPRQGIPPVLGSWEAYSEALRWGAAAGVVSEPSRWWWELRPHPLHGTLEVRVPDAQATVADAAAVAAVVQALCAHLGARWEAGDLPPPAEAWRIAENRWSAARHGVEGTLADLETGEARPTRARLRALLDLLAPHAQELGTSRELVRARELVRVSAAERLRATVAGAGLRGAVEDLARRFVDEEQG